MTTFLLIRHAVNDAVGKRITGWMQGVHLNQRGLGQAEELAGRLSGLPIVAVYSSPLERARETAEPIARQLGLRVHLCEEVGEIRYGDWTGRDIEELREVPLWQRFNLFRSSTRVPGGELMAEVQSRMIAALERMREQHPGDMVAVVSHGDVIKSAVAHYAGIHLDLFHRIEISPASVSIVVVNDYGPHILRINDTGELTHT